eukprot:GHVT01045177.1.p1 GENE.GHVT01045177.1~~GHVT01045177.1.p1  ORF type:complete len:757 (+),score=79.63 GHVT01045177.1:48-2318(+)
MLWSVCAYAVCTFCSAVFSRWRGRWTQRCRVREQGMKLLEDKKHKTATASFACWIALAKAQKFLAARQRQRGLQTLRAWKRETGWLTAERQRRAVDARRRFRIHNVLARWRTFILEQQLLLKRAQGNAHQHVLRSHLNAWASLLGAENFCKHQKKRLALDAISINVRRCKEKRDERMQLEQHQQQHLQLQQQLKREEYEQQKTDQQQQQKEHEERLEKERQAEEHQNLKACAALKSFHVKRMYFAAWANEVYRGYSLDQSYAAVVRLRLGGYFARWHRTFTVCCWSPRPPSWSAALHHREDVGATLASSGDEASQLSARSKSRRHSAKIVGHASLRASGTGDVHFASTSPPLPASINASVRVAFLALRRNVARAVSLASKAQHIETATRRRRLWQAYVWWLQRLSDVLGDRLMLAETLVATHQQWKLAGAFLTWKSRMAYMSGMMSPGTFAGNDSPRTLSPPSPLDQHHNANSTFADPHRFTHASSFEEDDAQVVELSSTPLELDCLDPPLLSDPEIDETSRVNCGADERRVTSLGRLPPDIYESDSAMERTQCESRNDMQQYARRHVNSVKTNTRRIDPEKEVPQPMEVPGGRQRHRTVAAHVHIQEKHRKKQSSECQVPQHGPVVTAPKQAIPSLWAPYIVESNETDDAADVPHSRRDHSRSTAIPNAGTHQANEKSRPDTDQPYHRDKPHHVRYGRAAKREAGVKLSKKESTGATLRKQVVAYTARRLLRRCLRGWRRQVVARCTTTPVRPSF